MNERGFVSVIGLWFAAVAVAIALCVLHAGWSQSRQGTDALLQARALNAVVTTAVIWQMEGFRRSFSERSLEGCMVRSSSAASEDGSTLVLTCEVSVERFHVTVDIGWIRVGDEWRPSWWNER